MNRKDFFKKACVSGICGCTGLSFLLNSKAFADDEEVKKEEQDWRIGFIQRRFAKLVSTFNSNLDEKTSKELLEQMGRECSNEGKNSILKFKGDTEGYLKEIEAQWAEKVEFDKEKKEITVFGRKKDKCLCPFVDNAIMPENFCNCSIGWFTQSFETLLDQNVKVTLLSSVLQGNERCTFKIKLA